MYTVFGSVLEFLEKLVQPLLDIITEALAKLIDELIKLLGTVFDKLEPTLDKIFDFIEGLVERLLPIFIKLFNRLVDIILQAYAQLDSTYMLTEAFLLYCVFSYKLKSIPSLIITIFVLYYFFGFLRPKFLQEILVLPHQQEAHDEL